MKGHILGFTPSTRTGTITGEDGRRYGFQQREWRSDGPIISGTNVDFEDHGDEALGVYPLLTEPLTHSANSEDYRPDPIKERTMAKKLGTVNVIWRNLDLYGFTGEILETQRTSETTISGNMNAPNAQISSRTDHYTQLFLRNADGQELDVEFESRTGFRAGQTATAIWASNSGPEGGKYIAVYNHTTGKINTVRRGNNAMAGIPFWNWICVLAIIVGCFGLMAHGLLGKLFWCGLGFGYVVFMMLCQKKLMDGTAAIIRAHKL